MFSPFSSESAMANGIQSGVSETLFQSGIAPDVGALRILYANGDPITFTKVQNSDARVE